MIVYIYENKAHRAMMPHSPTTPASANHWHIFTENHCIKMPMDLCCTAYKNCLKNRSGLEKEGITCKGKL